MAKNCLILSKGLKGKNGAERKDVGKRTPSSVNSVFRHRPRHQVERGAAKGAGEAETAALPFRVTADRG